jgi:ubiquinone/menaquinone biosynthesis C-methylase UbiE
VVFFDENFQRVTHGKTFSGKLSGSTALSSDYILPHQVSIPYNIKENQCIAVQDTGAYCATQHMEFLNKKPCPEILVNGEKMFLITKRGKDTDKLRYVFKKPKELLMRAEDTKLYASASEYFKGPDGMKNEVSMWFTAAGLLMQELSIKNGYAPFGGLGQTRGLKPEPISILDVCSGPGNFVNHLHFVFPNFTATCVDLNKNFIEAGKKLFPAWEWIAGDVVAISLDKQYDVITASSAFHHIPDENKPAFWANLMRHLQPNGFVLVCENFLPDYSNPEERLRAVETYYAELKAYYCKGNATAESQNALEEVYQLEKKGVEEHKVSFRMFAQQIASMGFYIFQDIIVWQPGIFKNDNAGSHVFVLKTI